MAAGEGNATLIADPLKEQDSDSSSSSSSDEGRLSLDRLMGQEGIQLSHRHPMHREASRGNSGALWYTRRRMAATTYEQLQETFRLAIKSMLPHAPRSVSKKWKRIICLGSCYLYSYEEDESLFGDGGDIDKHYYNSNFVQRFFVMLGQPNSCKLSVAVN